MIDIHSKLVTIPHFCHFGNPWSATDLSMASIMCTECRIARGEFTVEDLLEKKVDPLDVQYALDKVIAQERQEKQDRIDGKKPWHRLYWPEGPNGKYERVDCFEGRGSGPVTEDRICWLCKKSVDQ